MEIPEKNKKGTPEKVIKKRLQAIQLAESLGNVSEACRKAGIDRTSFYEWKRRYDAQGLAGLNDLLPTHKDHPNKTSPKVVKKIIEIALQNPDWGCIRIAEQLKKMAMKVSSPTVQKILIKNGLSSVSDRASALEAKYLTEKVKLSSAQIITIEKKNPAFKERGKEFKAGEMVVVDIFPVSTTKLKNAGYLFVAIDSFGMFATAEFYTDKEVEDIDNFLTDVLVSFYNGIKVKLKAIQTDKSKDFLSPKLAESLKNLGVVHLVDKKSRVSLNGFIQRFRDLYELDRMNLTKKSQNAAALKKAVLSWVEQYNAQASENFPNYGVSPLEIWRKKGIKIKP